MSTILLKNWSYIQKFKNFLVIVLKHVSVIDAGKLVDLVVCFEILEAQLRNFLQDFCPPFLMAEKR